MIKKLTDLISENSSITIAIKTSFVQNQATVMIDIKDANKQFAPIVINGNVDEIDSEFMNIITAPLQKAKSLNIQLEEFEKSVAENEKILKEKKERKTKSKEDHNEVLTEETIKDDKATLKEIATLEKMFDKKMYIEVKQSGAKLLEKAKEQKNIDKINGLIKSSISIINPTELELPEPMQANNTNYIAPEPEVINAPVEESEDINIQFEGF